MSSMETNRNRAKTMVLAYPFVLLVIGAALNLFLFGVSPVVVALPSTDLAAALVTASVLLLINHTWLMISTELSRLKYGLHATPEEWSASNARPEDAPDEGLLELERRHNAHRNTTENTVYFALLALTLSLVSPDPVAAGVWIIGYAVARLGYSHCYLTKNTGGRGLFMSLSLISLYGMASYLAFSLLA